MSIRKSYPRKDGIVFTSLTRKTLSPENLDRFQNEKK